MSGPVATLLPGVVENATGRVTVGASKKKVLLVDGSRPKRDLRSETMRKLGIEVDCAADIAEARCWWRAGLYDLVLMNVQEASARTDKFCDDVRNATPSQHIMFLVGKPEYLSTTPKTESEAAPQPVQSPWAAQGGTPRSANGSEQTGRGGILEACRRISAVRHLFEARSQAIRNRPVPQRDSEVPNSKRTRANEFQDASMPENLP